MQHLTPFRDGHVHDLWQMTDAKSLGRLTSCTMEVDWKIILLYQPLVMEDAFATNSAEHYQGSARPAAHSLTI